MNLNPYKKLVLIVLDGFGIATASNGNAVTAAKPANIDSLINNFPTITLQASGPTVGLPWGEMGNSEVGHLNIGAGRIVAQDLSRITNAVEDRSFFTNPEFLAVIEHVKKNNSSLHLMGLVSPGGVHSYDQHLYALIGLAAENGIRNVFIHMFLDGRDTQPQIALETLEKLEKKIQTHGVGSVATVSGRFYAMDRAQHWNLTEQTYRAIVMGEGPKVKSAKDAIETSYANNIFDEMVVPTVILQKDGNPAEISDNDGIIHFNFRSDRAVQLTEPFVTPDFNKFVQPYKKLTNIYFVSMTEFSRELAVHVAFKPEEVKNGFTEVISSKGLRQYHIAESEKYAHVTVFFNGGTTMTFPGEERKIVTSPESNYQNYVDVPEMSAYKVTDELVGKLREEYSFYLVNFANGDMVGHTGNFNASVKAVSVIDECLKKISDECLSQDICLIITADHGNVEELVDLKSGGIDKEHSTNPVPFILIGNQFKLKQEKEIGIKGLASKVPVGVLSDVAPTMLQLMQIEKPAEMTGVSLLPQLLEE